METVEQPSASDVPAPETFYQINSDNPWKGPDSFEEKDHAFFFGRSQETKELLDLIQRNTLTVLYGLSGLGKTSLLNAGVFPYLRDKGFFPVRVRLSFDTTDPCAQIITEIEKAAKERGLLEDPYEPPIPGEKENLWEYLHRMRFWRGADLLAPVLVFDPFEELFTQGAKNEKTRSAAHQLIEALADVIENYVPLTLRQRVEEGTHSPTYPFESQDYRIVLSLREDYLGELGAYRSRIPSLLRVVVCRLTPLNERQALEAIEGPGKELVDGDVAKLIVDGVAASQLQEGRFAETDTSHDSPIEPFLLSLTCQELNRRRIDKKQKKISAELVRTFQGDILTKFYKECLAGLDPRIEMFVETELIGHSGKHRNRVAIDDALHTPGITLEALNTLQERRLIRKEEKEQVLRIELIHDVLVPRIAEIRGKREQEEEQRRLELEAQRQREEAALQQEEEQRRLELEAQRQREEAALQRREAERQAEELRRERLLVAKLRASSIGLALLLLAAGVLFVLERRATQRTHDAESLTRDGKLRDGAEHALFVENRLERATLLALKAEKLNENGHSSAEPILTLAKDIGSQPFQVNCKPSKTVSPLKGEILGVQYSGEGEGETKDYAATAAETPNTVAPKQHQLAVCDGDGRLVWNNSQPDLIDNWDISHDGQYVATRSWHKDEPVGVGVVRVFFLKSGQPVPGMEQLNAPKSYNMSKINFTEDRTRFLVAMIHTDAENKENKEDGYIAIYWLPPNAMRHGLRIPVKETSPIETISFSKNGDYVAVVMKNGFIDVYDMGKAWKKWTKLTQLTTGGDPVKSLQFNDQDSIVVRGENRLHVWPKLLSSAVWDAPRTYSANGPVTSMGLAHDQDTIVAGFADGTIYEVSNSQGQQASRLHLHSPVITASFNFRDTTAIVAATADASNIVAAADDEQTKDKLRIIEPLTGAIIYEFSPRFANDKVHIQSAALNGDGSLVAVGGDDGELVIFRLRNRWRKTLKIPERKGVEDAGAGAFTSDSKFLVRPSGREIDRIDIENSAMPALVVANIPSGPGGSTDLVALDATHDVGESTGSIASITTNYLTVISNNESNQKVIRQLESRFALQDVKLSSDGKYVATVSSGTHGVVKFGAARSSSQSGYLHLFRVDKIPLISADEKHPCMDPHDRACMDRSDGLSYQPGNAVAFGPQNERLLAIGSEDGFKIFSINPDATLSMIKPVRVDPTKKTYFEMPFPPKYFRRVTAVAFSSEGNLFAAANDDGVVVYSTQNWEEKSSTIGLVDATSIAFNSDGTLLAVADYGEIRVINPTSGQLRYIFDKVPMASALSFAPSNRSLSAVYQLPYGQHENFLTTFELGGGDNSNPCKWLKRGLSKEETANYIGSSSLTQPTCE